ncbi:MAG TPA: hypothetical protein VHG72_14175, partial [Polyangia bacterium]|nr:hypothetical protein [Polyangia bacterium]
MTESIETADALRASRRVAAEQSLGTSEEAIYRAIERRLAEIGASGDVLDYGAGRGQLTRRLFELRRFNSVMGADLYARSADLPPEILWV